MLTSAEGGVFWRRWCCAHLSEGVVAVLIPAKGGAFWRSCCAPYSRGWRVLAKVLCSLQPKVGCFGQGGVVLIPAKGGVFWPRWCRARSRRDWGVLAKVSLCHSNTKLEVLWRRCCSCAHSIQRGRGGGECFGEGGVVALNSVGYLGEGDVMLTPLMLCSQRMGCLGEGGVVVLTSAKGGLFGRWWCRAHFSRGWGVWAKVWLCSFRQKAGSVFGEGVAVLTPAEDGVF